MVCKKNCPGLIRTVLTSLRHFQCVDCPYEANHARVSVEFISSGGSILADSRSYSSESQNKHHSAHNDSMFLQRGFSFPRRITQAYSWRVPLTISSVSTP